MSQLDIKIGPKIKAFRRQLGVQANKLAEKINISPSYLTLIEGGKRKIDGELLLRICQELKINISDLTTRTDINLVNNISEILDDKLYSKIKARSYLRRGYSINKIKNRLFHKGVDKNYVDDAITEIKENHSDADFFSAMKICKKRRIGPVRDENNRSLFYKKDIGILARSGFNYEISKKVLNLEKKEFIKFCKLI